MNEIKLTIVKPTAGAKVITRAAVRKYLDSRGWGGKGLRKEGKGNYGTYDVSAGPEVSYQRLGASWREVYEHYVQLYKAA